MGMEFAINKTPFGVGLAREVIYGYSKIKFMENCGSLMVIVD